MRGAWIEMEMIPPPILISLSLPMRGAWIEILMSLDAMTNILVAPHAGSVD